MKNQSTQTFGGVKRTLLALGLTTACSAALALPVFTLDPSAAGLGGADNSVTADNIIISNYSTARNDASGSFQSGGFLAFSNFQLANRNVQTPELNSEYGLFIEFSGTGMQSVGDETAAPTFGNFDTLEYTLFGYNGDAATFGFEGNDPTTSVGDADRITLASGSLVQGTVATSPAIGNNGASFTPSAAATLTFNVAAGAEGFFVSPDPFYNLAFAAFTNTVSQVEAFDGGFRIRQGGGAINFGTGQNPMAPIPEPGTYALMLAGLAALGTVVRRRRKN